MTGDATPLATATNRFCGFPKGVRVLPTVTAKARTRSSGLGSDLSRDATPMRRGTPITTSASFTITAETSPIPTKRSNGRLEGFCERPRIHRAR